MGVLTYWWTDRETQRGCTDASGQGGDAGKSKDNNSIRRIRSEDQQINCRERNQLSWDALPSELSASMMI